MRYHYELPVRVRQATDAELARLLRLYPHNARLVELATAEQKRRYDRPKPSKPFAYR